MHRPSWRYSSCADCVFPIAGLQLSRNSVVFNLFFRGNVAGGEYAMQKSHTILMKLTAFLYARIARVENTISPQIFLDPSLDIGLCKRINTAAVCASICSTSIYILIEYGFRASQIPLL